VIGRRQPLFRFPAAALQDYESTLPSGFKSKLKLNEIEIKLNLS